LIATNNGLLCMQVLTTALSAPRLPIGRRLRLMTYSACTRSPRRSPPP
jgi:hypothetical protein